MLKVEGKTFKKLVEKREYHTQTYMDTCPVKEQRGLTTAWLTKKGEKFYPEDISLDELRQLIQEVEKADRKG